MRARIIYYVVRGRARKSICVREKMYSERKYRRTKINQITARRCVCVCVWFLTKWSGNIGRTRVDDVINSCPVFVSAAAHFRGPTGLCGDGGIRFTCQKLINPPPLRPGALFHFDNGFSPSSELYTYIYGFRCGWLGVCVCMCVGVRCSVIYTYSFVIHTQNIILNRVMVLHVFSHFK